MVTCKDVEMQKLANGKAPANAAGDSLNHSLLAKNNRLRKATLNSRGGRRDHVPASV